MAEVFTRRLDVLLKQDIKPELQKEFSEKLGIYNVFGQGAEPIHSLGLEFVMQVTPGTHNRYGIEGDDWPEHVPPEEIKGRIRYARIYRTVSMTYDVYLHLTKLNNTQIIQDYGGRLMQDQKTCLKDLEQMLWGDGTGEVARVAANPTGSTNVTVTFTATTAGGNCFGNSKIRKNAYYQWFDTSYTQIVGGAAVTRSKCVSVHPTNNTAVFDVMPNTGGTCDVLATHILIPEGSVRKVPYGMKYFHQTTGYVQNLSVDTYGAIRPTSIAASGQLIGAPILERLQGTASFRFDGDEYKDGTWMWGPTQNVTYKLVGYPLRRAAMSDRTYDPGYENTAFNGNEPMVFQDIDPDVAYFYPQGKIKHVELSPYGPINIEGEDIAVQLRNSSTGIGKKAILDTLMFWAGNYYCQDPHSLQVITGLDITSGPLPKPQ